MEEFGLPEKNPELTEQGEPIEQHPHTWRQLVEKWSKNTRLRPFKSGKHAKAKKDDNAAQKRRQRNKRERQNRKRGRK